MVRSLFAFFFVLLLSSEVFSQHIPDCQGSKHSSPICWGYATGRAFGRSWSSASCPLSTLNLSTISTLYFNFYTYNVANLGGGDIIKFGSQHAAIVNTTDGTTGGTTVDQYSTLRSQEETVSLQNAINEFGTPTDICRKKQLWTALVQNSFTGGEVSVFGENEDSPFTTPVLYWEATINIDAIMDGEDHDDYVWRFDEWTRGSGGAFLSSSKATTSKLDHYFTGSAQPHTAILWREFNVTFQNSLPGASGGNIKVGSTTYSAPKVTQTVEVLSPNVSAQGLDQEINGIWYTFSQWSDGPTTNPRTFTPTGHITYTANYTAKPLPPTNVFCTGEDGNPVEITWTDNPNSNVTQYQIWRRRKPLGGQQEAPEHIATVNSGVEEYTDELFLATSSYSDYLLTYDVRSYYSVNGTYSDQNWNATEFGEVNFKKGESPQNISMTAGELPTEFAVFSYPNPFNPSTTLRYSLAEDAEVTLAVYDMMGREIAMLVRSQQSAGFHSAQWNGRNAENNTVASGVYFYRFSAVPASGAQNIIRSGKLILSK